MSDSSAGSQGAAAKTRAELLDLSDYDFELPQERIAQVPTALRDASRLLVLQRDGDSRRPSVPIRHLGFSEFPECLEAGDLVIVNATRVQAARLRGQRDSGGAVEVLLLGPVAASATDPNSPPQFRALVKLSGRLRVGISMSFSAQGSQGPKRRAEIIEVADRGEVVIEFEAGDSPYSLGEPPLPPYIRRPAEQPEAADPIGELDRERYQTIFARVPGAIAAPTAGLHFSRAVFAGLEARGIERREVVLHVGAGTFRPLDEASLASGRLHSESFELPEDTALAIAETKARGNRVIAVGTTSARVLEACARRVKDPHQLEPGSGETDIFLRPGSKFQLVDALLTNFHLPRSSLLLLVAAFAGRETILAAYREAIENKYRFYSYGDAMLIL